MAFTSRSAARLRSYSKFSAVEHFQGFSDNHYQHGMHTLAWISLWTIIILGVGCGVFGFFWGLGN